jgi:hypothetical protein
MLRELPAAARNGFGNTSIVPAVSPPYTGRVNPDPSSTLTALGAVGLAVLGARRRSRRPLASRPTAGERFAERGADLVRSAAAAGGGVGRLAGGATAGVISVGSLAAVTAVRGASNLSTSVGSGVVALCGEAAARAGGLVLDGGLAVTDLLRGRRAR